MAYLVGCIVALIVAELVRSVIEHRRDHINKRPWGPSGG